MKQSEMDQRRADKARQLLNDDLFIETMKAIKGTCYRKIEESDLDDTKSRENLYYLLKAANEFEAIFNSYLIDGAVALSRLNLKQQ